VLLILKVYKLSRWMPAFFGCFWLNFFFVNDAIADSRVTHAEVRILQLRNLTDPNQSLVTIARAVERLEADDATDLQLRLLILFANNLIDNGLLETAQRFLPAAIELAQSQKRPVALAHFRILKLATMTDMNAIDNVIASSIRGVLIDLRADQDQAQLAQTLLALARITNDLRKSDLTIELISQVKNIYQANTALADLEPHYWQLYGSVLNNTGDTEAAIEAQERALDYSLKKGQALNASTHHFYLASLHFSKQDWPRAKVHYIESYLISKRLNDLIGMAAGATSLATVYKKSNLAVDNAEALYWAQIALPLQQNLSDKSAIAGLQIIVGQLSLLNRSFDKAKELYQLAEQSPESKNAQNAKEFLKFGAELAANEGNFKLAYQRNVELNETLETQATKLVKNRLTSLRSLLAYSETERNVQAKKGQEFELAQRAESDRLQMTVALLGVLLLGAISGSAMYFRSSSKRYRNLAERDELTGAHSRRYLFDAGEAILKSEQRIDSHFTTAILLDVDHFKRVNDRWGHLVGDQVLKHCVEQIGHVVRDSDAIVARYGGEEFCVLIPNIDRSAAFSVAERIRVQMASQPYIANGINIEFTVSIGVAQTHPLAEIATLTELIQVADERLYLAKNQGRNRVVFDEKSTVV
jgi:diguanylate cyclase (GGDEF)-like protein